MAEAGGLTGGHRWTWLLGAGHLFQLAGLRPGALDPAARIATLAQRAALAVQLEFVRAQHAAK